LKNDVATEIIKVSKGDMRKCINFLQNIYLYVNWRNFKPEHREINEGSKNKDVENLTVEDFYKVIGSISPLEVQKIYSILVKDSYSDARMS